MEQQVIKKCPKCGVEHTPAASQLRARVYRCKACFNAARRLFQKRNDYHGMWGTPTWHTWTDMKRRCYSPSTPCYPNYGGRGITVCEEWRNSFTAFIRDMGPKPIGLTIERINNDGNYEPANCRWASRAEQNRNKRNTRSNPAVT